jgi:hypothetical protein
MTGRRVVALLAVPIALALVRQLFVPALTRLTGTWIGGVDQRTVDSPTVDSASGSAGR